MATIFTKIVQGELPCHKIAETDQYLAFLDIRPVSEGHTLVIPKLEVDYIFDMEDDLLGGMMVFSKRVAKALRAAVPCVRIGVAVIGLEVPHAHIHLIPINTIHDLSFDKGFLAPSQEELMAVASTIRQHYV
ncbi:MAG TPA: HIT family protein [Saprospiraceae bacterium]|nr:HIT family protein [Saprospiraceae bacterium]HMP12571.1 HIT family protein [Saprospiraceae bacterium]